MTPRPARLYLLPSARQAELIRAEDNDPSAVILTVADAFVTVDGRTIVTEQVKRLLVEAEADRTPILCLNELALYVLAAVAPGVEAGIDRRLLAVVTKSAQRAFISGAGLRVSPARFLTQLPDEIDVDSAADVIGQLPVVVKPDFGFASMLVRRITSPVDWRSFVEVAGRPERWPLRADYATGILGRPELLNAFLVEPDLSGGTFLSVAFAWDGQKSTAFPVAGLQAESSALSNFAWRQFVAPAALTPQQLAELEEDLAALARVGVTRPGVYEAELLATPNGPVYLEFSPRPTGGLVPDLVRHAYGVDIDRAAVRLFLGHGHHAAVAPARGSTFLGRRVDARSRPAPAGATLLASVNRDSAGTALRDEIWQLDARGVTRMRSRQRSGCGG